MIRRPWLLPIGLPLIALWLVLRAARYPLNAVLWACDETISYLAMEPDDRSIAWPGWRHFWGWA
jgi:hypothetical protein